MSATVAVPVLPVSDLIRSVAWYERLGFVVQAGFDGYAILSYDGAEVHLNEFHDAPPATETFSGAYLRVADADAVHAHWSAMGAPTIAVPEDQPYGVREFATEDLDGNLWRVGSRIGADLEPEPGPVAGSAPVTTLGDGLADGLAAEPALEAGSTGLAAGEAAVTSDEVWYSLVAEAQTCPRCGLVNGELAARAIGAQVRDEVHPFGKLLAAADDDAVRHRATPTSWSALEYGVHVRDALSAYAERIIRTLAEHGPQLRWWDHDEALTDEMANESDVGAVVDDLARNAAKLSEALRLVTDDDWDRPATRKPGERMTIELQARFALHEVVHHRADAQAALDAAVS
jgi:catechol 2,3-dioxygenase-like lactoylglutathione lyase family enzyme